MLGACLCFDNLEKRSLNWVIFARKGGLNLCIYIFMHLPDVIGGIPGVPSNFYPSLERLLFKVVFSLHEKKGEVFVDAV